MTATYPLHDADSSSDEAYFWHFISLNYHEQKQMFIQNFVIRWCDGEFWHNQNN